MHLRFTAVLIAVCVSVPALAQVNGWEEEIQGIPIIHVWGTDYEMGYALGYLDGDRFATLMEDIIIPSWGVDEWDSIRICFTTYFTVPPRIDTMVDGMIAGIGDRPDSMLYSEGLGRNYDDVDLHAGHAITDISAVRFPDTGGACTSLSAWDTGTAADPVLQGAPALARNLDSEYHPLLAEMHVAIAYRPDLGNEMVTFGYPMNLDCSTAMNEYGICITRNAAYHSYISYFSPAFMPIGYAGLLGLMEDDFDGSGTNDLGDLISALTFWNRAPSKNLHVAAPRTLGYMDEPCVVLEINNDSGYVCRYGADDPVLGPDHMAATNHYRLLYPPDPCNRYELLSDSIAANPDMTLERFWSLMGCCDIPGFWYAYLTVLFQPESRITGIAFCDSLEEAWEKDPVMLTWNQLFPPAGIEGGSVVSEIALSLFPNPSDGTVSVGFSLPAAATVELVVFDITGRVIRSMAPESYPSGNHLVEFQELSDGVYFCRITAGESATTGRFVVIE